MRSGKQWPSAEPLGPWGSWPVRAPSLLSATRAPFSHPFSSPQSQGRMRRNAAQPSKGRATLEARAVWLQRALSWPEMEKQQLLSDACSIWWSVGKAYAAYAMDCHGPGSLETYRRRQLCQLCQGRRFRGSPSYGAERRPWRVEPTGRW